MATLTDKISRRLLGFPRTLREIDRSLILLGHLRSLGWHQSIRAGAAVDHAGRPLPWFTYPAIEWLQPRLAPSLRVFEFGAGQSTLWFARHVLGVISVEHDAHWSQQLKKTLPGNAMIMHFPESTAEDSPYVKSIGQFDPRSFDIIVIDGQQRPACARHSLSYLKEDGLIVFDNSDRPENRDGLTALLSAGLYCLDFVGFTPGYGHLSCTSILSRSRHPITRDDGLQRFLGY